LTLTLSLRCFGRGSKMTLNRPTGIIRTLPYSSASTAKAERRVAFRRAIGAFRSMDRLGDSEWIYIAMQAQPKAEVLHCYIVMDGAVRLRANIAGFEPGDSRECWDGSERRPKYWMVLTAPVSFAPHKIKMKGFQGFRYTEALW